MKIMRKIIASLILAACISCNQNESKPTEPEAKPKDPVVINKPPADTPVVVATPATPQTKEQLWDVFWTKFSAAVNQRDKNAMIALSLQTNEFFDGGGGGTAAQWINTADEETWKYWQKAVSKGTKVFEKSQRITKNDYMYFDFKNGNWCWAGVVGD